jgi:hypothetical protein
MLGASKSIWGFNPVSAVPGCTLWLDGSDSNTMFQNTGGTTPVTAGGQSVELWRDKSVNSNNVTGTGTWSGSNMVFNGSTNAFSNLGYVFPFGAYSLFAVYSNTVAPAGGAYMNVMYGSNGFPMLGTFGSNRDVTARSVVANTGALGGANIVGWAARIGGAGTDIGYGIACDYLGNVFVTGESGAALTVYNQGASGTGVVTLPFTGGTDAFVAKYNSIGDVQWAARIGGAGTGVLGDVGNGIAADPSGNVLVTGTYGAALTIYNQGSNGTAFVTLPYTGGTDAFIAKYNSIGNVEWAARIAGTGSDRGNGIASDPSGNVLVTGNCDGAAVTIYNQGSNGTAFVTLPVIGGSQEAFIAKYNSIGDVQWAARIAGTGIDAGFGIATDPSGNVLVTGYYRAAVTIYNQGSNGSAFVTLPIVGGQQDAFVAKYNSIGDVQWAARIGAVGNLDQGNGIAADPSGNVLVTGNYDGGAVTIYNQGSNGAAFVTLPLIGGQDAFIAKYNSIGNVEWAARIAGTVSDNGSAIATDPSGNVFIIGWSTAVVTFYNQGAAGAGVITLQVIGGFDTFVAKYNSIGVVQWAAQIAGATSTDVGRGIATDPSGNVFVTGWYNAALTFYNKGSAGAGAVTLPLIGGQDAFVAKYSSDGFLTAPTPANSNVLVGATYLPSTMSPFINGNMANTFAGTTLATTGVFIGGPSNRYNGTLSELLIYNNTLNISQRQGVEGYLANKWGLRSKFPLTQPYLVIPPFSRYFAPMDIPGCTLWMDGSDPSTMNSTSAVTIWNDKSGSGNTMTGSGTWSGSNMVFNGSTNAFSNLGYVFPFGAYSLFAVYSNTVAPAASQYMNVMYGSNGFPMLGTFDVGRSVTARSVVANTGALGANVGWVAQIESTQADFAYGIDTDPFGNIVVTGLYSTVVRMSNATILGGVGATLSNGNDVFVAKYSSTGRVLWAAQLRSTAGDSGNAIATDPSGNVLVTGSYQAALTICNATTIGGTYSSTLAFAGGSDCFVAKYSSDGLVLWAAQIASTGAVTFDRGFGITTDTSGNVFVTGSYLELLTLNNAPTIGGTGITLAYSGGTECFVAKYSSDGLVLWAARITTPTANDQVLAIATDSLGNMLVSGSYGAGSAVTFSNASTVGGAYSQTFTSLGGNDAFVAKYSSTGTVIWATRIGASSTHIQGELAYGIATDPSGNVLVAGQYASALSIYNKPGTAVGGTLPAPAGSGSIADAFIVKYSSDGDVLWAAQIANAGNGNNFRATGVATDSSGNVLVVGFYASTLTAYSSGRTSSIALAYTGSNDIFVAKYNSTGVVQWATRIAGTGTSDDIGYGIATDPSGNVLVTGQYGAAVTLFNKDGTTGATLPSSGLSDVFIAKYNPDGYITNAPVPASSNVLVDATYLPSTMSPFINGSATTATLAGTTLATTGIFLGGPSNYFNGTLSELLIYSSTLTSNQRQQVEGYLLQKWGLRSQIISTQPYTIIPPATLLAFSPTVIPGCEIWLDAADNLSMNSTTSPSIWRDKSGNSRNMAGTATWTGSNMSFNGSSQQFSNLTYVFPSNAYSMFAVYSNTVAPGGNGYMNVVYGNSGYPMLGTFDVNRHVSARSVVANTGNLTRAPDPGWAARIASAGNEGGSGIAADSSGNVFVAGYYAAALTLFNQGSSGTAGATLPFISGIDCFIAKYSSVGAVLWAARIAGTGTDNGNAIATDPSGNVLVTGQYSAALTLYNANTLGGLSNGSLPLVGGADVFIAKYSSAGAVQWAARIAGASGDIGRGIATDPSGNVLITGQYSGVLTLYNANTLGGLSNGSLSSTGGNDCFVAKYLPDGTVSWAARITGTSVSADIGNAIATDPSGNVLVTGSYTAALTIYNANTLGGLSNGSLPFVGGTDCFIAKYLPDGTVSWAARIAGTTTSTDIGYGIAADSLGNVLVTGYYSAALTIYNANTLGGLSNGSLPFAGSTDIFVAKYSSAGAVLWAARIAGGLDDIGYGIAADSLGNVLVTGFYSAALTFYNKGSAGSADITLANAGANDCFIAKYLPDGTLSWATRIAGTLSDNGYGITTDPSGNVFVTGQYGAALTFYNRGTSGLAGVTLTNAGGNDCFIAKYSPDGFISIPTPANSNVLVGATYASSVFSPFVDGIAQVTLPGTTLATTGIFICGPTSRFNGTLSELIIYARTLTTDQRQQVEGYLAKKWGITLPITHPYYASWPFMT